MKKATLLFLLVVTAVLSYSQSTQDCNKIKLELARLQEENLSLRNSLKINEPTKEISSDNIHFKLLSINGDKNAQTVTFIFTLETNIANWYIMSDIKSIIDIDGNEYKLGSYSLGAEKFLRKIALYTNVPIKCTYTFTGILPSVKVIRLLKFDYNHKLGEKYFVEFRDLTIDWK